MNFWADILFVIEMGNITGFTHAKTAKYEHWLKIVRD